MRCRRRGVYSVAVVGRCVCSIRCVVGCDGMFLMARARGKNCGRLIVGWGELGSRVV